MRRKSRRRIDQDEVAEAEIVAKVEEE